MPIVLLKCKQFVNLEGISLELSQYLPRIISTALDIPENPEARLTEDDIEVDFRWTNARDINAKDIRIIIVAHDYPERTQNIEARKEAIIEGVRLFLSKYDRKLTGWVWVLPQQNSAFGKI